MRSPDVQPPGAQPLDLSADHFALFGLERGFTLDRAWLLARYRELQQATHPDRFVSASEAERRWSVQAASRVNDAYATLKAPLPRAVYLLELAGVATGEESDTRMDPMFLMEQMELREALEAAEGAGDPHAALDAVRAKLDALEASATRGFEAAIERGDTAAARTEVRQWQFVDKLGREVGEIEARLDDG